MRLLNTVVLAEDYQTVVEWYKKTFELEVTLEEAGDYQYTELSYEGNLIVGVASASEMKHVPSIPRNNTTLMQLIVKDIHHVFKNVEAAGGKILFGPAMEAKYQFHYGGVEDIEGNQIWIVDEG